MAQQPHERSISLASSRFFCSFLFSVTFSLWHAGSSFLFFVYDNSIWSLGLVYAMFEVQMFGESFCEYRFGFVGSDISRLHNSQRITAASFQIQSIYCNYWVLHLLLFFILQLFFLLFFFVVVVLLLLHPLPFPPIPLLLPLFFFFFFFLSSLVLSIPL